MSLVWFLNLLGFKSSEFEPTESTAGQNEGLFVSTHWDEEDYFFCDQKGG